MKLEGFNKGLFDRFCDDTVQRMHLFIGGTSPTNANGVTYTGDHCQSEGGSTCTDGYKDDVGTKDGTK
jgi:hypothetical protein